MDHTFNLVSSASKVKIIIQFSKASLYTRTNEYMFYMFWQSSTETNVFCSKRERREIIY